MSWRGGQRARKSPEHDLQKQAIQWLNYALTPPAFAWSVDHAGGGVLAGSLRKARGVRAGQPDIWVLAPGSKLVGIELKAPAGRVSNEQIAFAHDCVACGVRVYECRSIDRIEQVLRLEGVPLRATLGRAAEPVVVGAARSTA